MVLCACALILSFCSMHAGDRDEAYILVRAHTRALRVPDCFVKKSFFDARTAIDPTTVRLLGLRSPVEVVQRVLTRGSARRFMLEHARVLTRVQGQLGVPASLIAALICRETNFGAFCGTHDVFNVFFTYIVALEQRRAWAVREMAAYMHYCFIRLLDPHMIKGSYAGAFGYGQFMPTSFIAYAIDYDGDGIPRHDSWADVIASIANYLVKNGFKPLENSYEEGSPNWRAIYAYNHSRTYVQQVLALKGHIELLLR